MIYKIEHTGELPNWGGGFPVVHEFSTINDVKQWNETLSKGLYDEALSATDKVLSRMLDSSARAPMGLYLFGKPGNGKTHVAIGLGRILAENGVMVSYFHAPRHDTKSSFTKMSSSMLSPGVNEKTEVTQKSIFSEKVFDRNLNYWVPRGKSAIIFDDYRPEHQMAAYGAVEAAAEMGGLVIMTSNHPDPFRLLAAPKQELNVIDLAVRMMVELENAEALERADKASEERYSEIRA